jgi:hypothetical protein
MRIFLRTGASTKVGESSMRLTSCKVQEIRGYETVTRIANAPEHIQGREPTHSVTPTHTVAPAAAICFLSKPGCYV